MATRSPFTTVAEPTILVFGATGALGGHVLEGLIARGVAPATVTAAGRNPSRLAELGKSGFATAKIDMSDSARVADVVAGHRRVVLISGGDPNRLGQHAAVIKAATKAQVEHVYYTSGLRADDVRFEIGADHKGTEDALIASGVTYTILRNGWYIENYIQAMAGPRYTGILAAAVGDAVIAAASRRDLADALAAVVMTDGDNATYNLSGDTDFTYADIAQAMSIVLEREVSYTPVTPDELRSMLVGSGMGEAMAGFLVSLDEPIAAGMFAKAGDDLTRLIARPTTTLVDGLTGR
jgi:NAD(P)H dehydrogenase (quinone)